LRNERKEGGDRPAGREAGPGKKKKEEEESLSTRVKREGSLDPKYGVVA